MNTMKHRIYFQSIALVLSFLFLVTSVSAQDSVYLKNGSQFTGKIIQFQIGGNLLLETEGGTQVVVPSSAIKTVTEGETVLYGKKKHKKDKVLSPLASGKGYFSWENRFYRNNGNSGLGVSLSYLYQWKHYLSAGVGIGYDSYNFSRQRGYVPIFAQARAYVLDSAKSPFVDVKLGYGIADQNETTIETQGGLYGQTSAGLRFGSGGFRTTLAIGIQIQDSSLESYHPWNSGVIYEDRQYRRFFLNLGFIF